MRTWGVASFLMAAGAAAAAWPVSADLLLGFVVAVIVCGLLKVMLLLLYTTGCRCGSN